MNTHRAIIETSVPPSMELIAAGPLGFCQAVLANWVTLKPLGEFESALIVEIVETGVNHD